MGRGDKITLLNTVSLDNEERCRAGRRRWHERWRLRRRRWRSLITRWPFSVWTARLRRNHRGAGGGGGGDGGVGDRTWAKRTPAPVRGVVLPETGGASDRPGSSPRRWAAVPGPGPIVERLRRTRSAGPAAGLPVESTRSSLPSAVLAFPSGCENNKQTVLVRCAVTGTRTLVRVLSAWF